MVGLTGPESEQLRSTLQDAVVKCSERCLYQSAKWAAELLASLPSTTEQTPNSDRTEEDSQMTELDQSNGQNGGVVPVMLTPNSDPEEARLEAEEVSRYLLAKSYFDCREYDRCAAVFVPDNVPMGPISTNTPAPPTRLLQTPPSNKKGKGKAPVSASASTPLANPKSSASKLPSLSQRSLFLALYAKFMAGEKRKDEESEMILGPADGGATVNRELLGLGQRLEGWFSERSGQDGNTSGSQGWLEYLYGVILSKEKNDEDARKWLIKSIRIYPFNWGAWQILTGLIGTSEDLNHILPSLPNHIMTFIFRVHANQELYQSTEQVHSQLTQLEQVFPSNPFLKTQRALLFHHSKDFEEAESIFSELTHQDPYRIDSLDHYSNILYVMALRPKLAFIAQLATSVDKFRPETCCVVGNYYSLKSEHEKAVMYFRRALTLDRDFLSAWTLMGHEYVEMKNTHAAIESYRRAVDINRRDYRAWYGLGQTYEVLEMHYYALFYYQRAASLRPYDPKMWQAVGNCFNKMDRAGEAIKALKRALLAGTYYDVPQTSSASASFASNNNANTVDTLMDPEVLYQIALMYEKLADYDEAAAYMELTLAQEDGGLVATSTAGDDAGDDPHRQGAGVGVTQTTSKARMWLAKWEFSRGRLGRAMELANELCQDGVDVEEAKALVRDLRARLEVRQPTGTGTGTGQG
ncbi:MAG: Anaphase-promoting complex subunit 23 [Peltula sp. TS41687]|nr:MAG: Anaphase-promoting complex subunit 23 [Peltula sp. TS41687]